jgi:NADH-quinone oxidoreductase subunit G
LTSAAYRFRARPFDLVSTETVCEHCASGCALRTDHRAGAVTRRLARTDPDVNEEWNCDKGRFAFPYVREGDRITRPLVRNADGVLQQASWTEAMTAAAAGLLEARDNGGVGVLTGGRLTLTDAYAYAKFARLALRTNDIDFRARPHSAEEAAFLGARVAGSTPTGGAVTYAALEKASVVLLVAFEPEEESPILFLRLRKAARKGLAVFSVSPLLSNGLHKLSATLIGAAPGDEPAVLAGLAGENIADDGVRDAAERNRVGALLRTPGAVVLVG